MISLTLLRLHESATYLYRPDKKHPRYIVMAYVVMAYEVMAYIVMTYMVLADTMVGTRCCFIRP